MSYLRQTYDCLEEAREIAITMETKAKHEMETWYNKKARDRVFTTGDLVLVMLLSSTNKLLAKWMGPYLLRKCYPTPPTKSLFPMQGRTTELSTNMLLKWESPVSCLPIEHRRNGKDNRQHWTRISTVEDGKHRRHPARHGREAEPREEGRH